LTLEFNSRDTDLTFRFFHRAEIWAVGSTTYRDCPCLLVNSVGVLDNGTRNPELRSLEVQPVINIIPNLILENMIVTLSGAQFSLGKKVRRAETLRLSFMVEI
jgi:hypothetical protein